jgi:hypothetical protein
VLVVVLLEAAADKAAKARPRARWL